MKYKIIVAGPVGAGKTTAVNSLTDDNAFMTDAAVSDEVTKKRKSNTTVGMDFGVVRLNDNDVAHVYGTPGQQRFNFMWEILSEGAHGLILLFDNTRNYPFRDLKYFTESFSDLIASRVLVIGVTRSDVSNEIPLEAYQQWLKELGLNTEVRFVDAREKDDIEQLVHTLVEQVSIQQQQSSVSTLTSDTDKDSIEKALKASATENLTAGAAFSTAAMGDKRKLVVGKGATDGELTNEQDKEALHYAPADSFHFDENAMQQVATLQDVEGVTLTNSYGELLHSTINDDDINEFIAFLSGITPALEDASGMGVINRIMLRGPLDENLTVFVEKERSLGVSSNKATSVPALSQKIEDMLQWV
ncbi:MAG: ATP/GTP-binding protein [Cocleimonas sp.]|nr:ATP/GTP-binding protein [Cocleimonas sp.]